jgi:hypothetical protein
MKKLYFVLAFLVVLAVSCSKDSPWNAGHDIDQFSGNTALKACGAVIKVYPGPNDTQALIDAFAQSKTFGKNTAVKLMPGTFKIGRIEVKEFNGTFSGSGKGKTIITNLPDLSTPDEVMLQNKVPALITFIGGDVVVSDLSVKLSEKLIWLGNLPNNQEMNMLLFSDYSADFIPSIKHINVNLNNIEIIGLIQKDYHVYDWDGTTLLRVIDCPYVGFRGVKFSPDMIQQSGTLIPRSNIDATVTNSKFSKLAPGMQVWGCKKGNFKFGEEGGNIFTDNSGGLFVQENMGITVKIMKNVFNIPYYSGGIDLNAYERSIFEYAPSKVGSYEIRNNIFNNHLSSVGFGLYDNWRYDHPENPDCMKMIWDNNTFNDLADGAGMGNMFGIKDGIFSNNKIVGNAQGGYLSVWGSWLGDGDPNYLSFWTENCKFLNNLFLQKNFVIELKPTTKNCLIMGDLRNVIVNDNGVNNKVIGRTH